MRCTSAQIMQSIPSETSALLCISSTFTQNSVLSFLTTVRQTELFNLYFLISPHHTRQISSIAFFAMISFWVWAVWISLWWQFGANNWYHLSLAHICARIYFSDHEMSPSIKKFQNLSRCLAVCAPHFSNSISVQRVFPPNDGLTLGQMCSWNASHSTSMSQFSITWSTHFADFSHKTFHIR